MKVLLTVAEALLLFDDGVAGDKSSWRCDDHSQGAAHERLLRALPGTDVLEGKAGGEFVSVEIVVAGEELSVVLVAELMFVTGLRRVTHQHDVFQST
ncbi:hypothetical protein K7X08_011807 [Anisodus acutangulus]|uniref:Uncharacterized protein n=1 Tax=Anisodus acutangulus TaxID=402998 RepID=A0A9Q1MKQ8_9SOLA|nr:hypothetical protein K7X08_011807 [Anisodus acutangulus]